MTRMMLLVVAVIWITTLLYDGSDAIPVSTCPGVHVVVFLADVSSQCVYHRCGPEALSTHRCPPGSAVPRHLRITTDAARMCRPSRNPYACGGDPGFVKRFANGKEEEMVEMEEVKENTLNDGSGEIVDAKNDPDEKGSTDLDQTKVVDVSKMMSAREGQKQLPRFAVHVERSHVLGGRVVGRGMRLQQCLDLCQVTPRCLGVDYTSVGGLCWEHGRDTVCKPVRHLQGTVHFKKLPCSEDTEQVREVYASAHIVGGELYCSACTAATCLRGCAFTATCNAADYNHAHRTCHLHMALTGCQTLRLKEGCTHFKRNTCPSPPSLTRPPPFTAAPQYNPIIYTCDRPCVPPTDARDEYGALFLPVRRPAPSVLPSGWAAYPAARLGGGELVATDRTGNGCFATCDADAECAGADFDSDTGHCFVQRAADICTGELMVTDYSTWYHVKKSPCGKPDYNPILCACA